MSGNHDHSHSTSNIRLAFFLNLSFTIFEIIGGLATNSIAILSDAVHDLGDSISLGMAWFLGNYSEKDSNQKYTYGYRRYSLLGALINSAVLVGGSIFVLSEAIPRLMNPQSFDAQGMVLVAIVGVLVNGAAVLRLRGTSSMNAEVVTWHLLEDVLGWVAVLVVGIVSLFIDLPILDPILSILITLYVMGNAVQNLRKTVMLFLQASPQGVDMKAIDEQLQKIEGVKSTHHTHIWSLDGEHNVFTSHFVLSDGMNFATVRRIKRDAREIIKDLRLEHTTIEFEFSDADCSMVEDVVADEVQGK
ncbi:MAG: cation diffusion facilitator family transporter [Anaerolineae bacterium]|nr:cation diffusion facilitator family transporter [Anaerolineae bacterium]